MTATQPPYYTTNFDSTYTLASTPTTTTTPIGTAVGKEATTADPRTGPAPTTAGPHRTDMANRLDPRVDSDLNNRAQYAPGTTVAGNVHPGATEHVSNPESSNEGPHSSSLLNKLDPRVDSKSGTTTTKTTNQTGTGSARAPTDTTGAGLAHGSSTSSAGAPGVQDTRSQYDPSGTGYNSSTGSGYTSTSAGYGGQSTGTGYNQPSGYGQSTTSGYNQPSGYGQSTTSGYNQPSGYGQSSTSGYNQPSGYGQPSTSGYNQPSGYGQSTGSGYNPSAGYSGQDYRADYAPSTVDKESGGSTESKGTTGSSSAQKSDKMGKGIQSAFAGVHGSGESLRGTLTSAIDKAFGHEESASKNEAIATQGEREVQTGNLTHPWGESHAKK